MERFWSKVDRRGPDECWPWKAALNDARWNYGKFNLGRGHGTDFAHRIAWRLTHGAIPGRLQVLHSCDNPPCVNPAHLFLGTQKANIADMITKRRGRWSPPRGERSPHAKLTAQQVAAIRADQRSNTAVAAAYGVTRRLIYNIKRRLAWRHVP